METADCWNHVGIYGDRSCVELESVIHCQNCPVYTRAGSQLFEREATPEYLQEWAEILATPLETTNTNTSTTFKEHSFASTCLLTGDGTGEKTSPQKTPDFDQDAPLRSTDTLSVILFRIGEEHFALPTSVLQEVTHPVISHRLPHCSDRIFTGLVNIRGEILLCASLNQLLEVETSGSVTSNNIGQKRMLVVQNQETRWVFLVDQVYRITRFQPHDLQRPPVVATKATQSFTQNLMQWQGKTVSYLDADLLLYTLDRHIL